MQRDQFESGHLKTDEWEAIEADLIGDIDGLAVDTYLAIGKAITAADATETLKTDLQELMRDGWNRVRRLSA